MAKLYRRLTDSSALTSPRVFARVFPAPTGRGARIRHADGLLVEYLEHRPSDHDVDTPGL